VADLKRCVVCDSADLIALASIKEVPIHCNVLSDTKEAALGAAKAPLELVFCKNCGHIYNADFDPGLMAYHGHYENALHYSPHFQRYADSVADRLITRYNVHKGTIIEIGSGGGEFLDLMCRKGQNTGIGFDPSQADAPETAQFDNVRIVPDFFSDKYADTKGDFVVSRHVLEHIEYPRDFAKLILGAAKSDATRFYIEVPNGAYTLATDMIWDLIYEHCSYFTQESLIRLLESTGYAVIEAGNSYDGQFLYAEAEIARPGAVGRQPRSQNTEDLSRLAERFSQLYQSTVKRWNEQLSHWRDSGQSVILWGAGSKGSMFMNSVRACNGYIQYVVDVNPRKEGRFVAGGGQQIIPPDRLKEINPDIVLIMNPIYRDEISRTVSELGLSAEVDCISTE